MVPKFGGKKEELRVCINKCEELWSYIKPGSRQAKFISVLKNNLFDEAALLLLDEDRLNTWEDIKTILNKVFSTDPNHSNNIALLESLGQKSNESVESFCKRIKEILGQLKSVVPEGATKIFCFKHCVH